MYKIKLSTNNVKQRGNVYISKKQVRELAKLTKEEAVTGVYVYLRKSKEKPQGAL